MALTATAERMLETLPDYYWGNEIVERIVQAWANEIDRYDARIEVLKAGLVPGTATDELGLLSAWERILDLPVAPADASVNQRQATVRAALRRLNAVTAADVLVLLEASIGPSFTVLRNTPGPLQDTIEIPFAEGSYSATQVEAIAGQVWPAHRLLFLRYSTGFILDVSRLDVDTL